MIEWNSIKLGDIAVFSSGGTPPKDNPTFWNGVIPWISAKNMTDHKVSSSDLCISDQAVCYTKCASPKDILLLVRGSGLYHDIPINLVTNTVTYNQDIKAIRCYDPEFQEYLYYWLKGNKKILRDMLEDTAIGAGKFDTGLLKNIRVSYPKDKKERDKLVEIASDLFAKIDVLQRQNETLEHMAEALFWQWFVVEADDKWELRSLVELATYTNGLALQKYPPKNESDILPVIKIREMNQGITESSDLCSASIPEPFIVDDGDILFSWSGSLDVIVWTGGKGALNQHLFKVASEVYPSWLVYFSTRYFLQEFRDIAADKATTMGHIQRKHLAEAQLRIPDQKLVKHYGETIQPLFEKKVRNSIQVRKLIILRDTLLPRLMNGEVIVCE